jgi:hypothetical protein
MKNFKKGKCWKILADYYFDIKDFDKAEKYY